MANGPYQPLPTLRDVPLFPLPNVVLFPRAVLPLHVFEPRYRRMTADALAGDKRIAMALLRDDWQANYHGTPRIHEIVCVGRIVRSEVLKDGRYNLLLQGETRGRVLDENRMLAYRRAEIEPLAERRVFDVDLAEQRDSLVQIVHRSELMDTTLGRELSRLLDGPLCTADLADICAFNLIDDVAAKQRLLEESDVNYRVREIVRSVAAAHPPRPTSYHPQPRGAHLN